MNGKYMVFEWEQYYALGGWRDYKCSFDLMADVEEYHRANPLAYEGHRQVVLLSQDSSPVGLIVVHWRGDGD